jgi:hypothetical protein
MSDTPSAGDRLRGLEGTDDAALGISPPPESAPDSAEPDGDPEVLVPGADFADRAPTERKPWFTSLAAESDQAGVGNDPDEARDEDPV